MRAIGGRVQEAHARLREITAEWVEQRLAHAVLRLLCQAGRPAGPRRESGTTLYLHRQPHPEPLGGRGILKGGAASVTPRALRRIAEGGQA